MNGTTIISALAPSRPADLPPVIVDVACGNPSDLNDDEEFFLGDGVQPDLQLLNRAYFYLVHERCFPSRKAHVAISDLKWFQIYQENCVGKYEEGYQEVGARETNPLETALPFYRYVITKKKRVDPLNHVQPALILTVCHNIAIQKMYFDFYRRSEGVNKPYSDISDAEKSKAITHKANPKQSERRFLRQIQQKLGNTRENTDVVESTAFVSALDRGGLIHPVSELLD